MTVTQSGQDHIGHEGVMTVTQSGQDHIGHDNRNYQRIVRVTNFHTSGI
jgi:hypothetical protein